MTKYKKNIGFGIGLIIILGLVFFMVYHHWHKAKLKPIPNSHPKYFVTIKGNIQPNMPYPMTVMFRASYAAYNPKCAVKGSRLNMSGLDYMPGKSIYYPAKPTKQGDYVIKIPIDAYKPGKCDWKMAWVMYGFVKKIPPKKEWSKGLPWADMVRFGKKISSVELPTFPMDVDATSFCGANGSEFCTGTDMQGVPASNVLRDKNYIFIQNIKAKKEKKNDSIRSM